MLLGDALTNTNVQVKNYDSVTSKIRTVVSPSGVYVWLIMRNNQMKIGDATKIVYQKYGHERKEQVIDSLDPKTHCRFHCIRHKSNQLIDRMIKGEEQRVLEDFDLFI